MKTAKKTKESRNESDVKVIYTKHIAVFLDILGFKNIAYSENAEERLSFLYTQVLQIIQPFFEKLRGFEFRLISDSILACQELNSNPSETIIKFCNSIRDLQFHLLFLGFPIRGGIAVGNLFIKKKHGILVGPAIIEAYTLESECSIVPRIVLSQTVLNECSALKQSTSAVDPHDSSLPRHKYFCDEYFINFMDCSEVNSTLLNLSNSDAIRNTENYRRSINDHITAGYRGNHHHFEKYLWIKEYLVWYLSKRIQNSEDESRESTFLRLWLEQIQKI